MNNNLQVILAENVPFSFNTNKRASLALATRVVVYFTFAIVHLLRIVNLVPSIHDATLLHVQYSISSYSI